MSLFYTYISVVSGVLPVFAALYNYRHLNNVLKIAALYFLISTMFDWGEEIASNYHVTNNFPAIHAIIIISLLFYTIIYYKAFSSLLLKRMVFILSSLGFLVLIVSTIFFEGFMDYPSISNTVLSMVAIVFSLVYFYQLLTRQEFVHIEKQGLFWINAGVLLYFATNVFLFMLFAQILKDHKEDFYMIHTVTNIIANILFTVGLLCKPQKTP
ncbi:hypothetical protein KXD93_27725 [Mucilaginibacter sp. BJC16-A38]|uniref:hypothetical protein n=1 Tax=Mucilaginibacter phenanthrenivorans TaxID=1234842 RepID=UPI0021579DF2|nr:hypothetical protein [Mucilaginibacter phenanthrenivorans]MCR8561475.1 hypothetical protein [Mucilaginibacter phenanthrenivorans]